MQKLLLNGLYNPAKIPIHTVYHNSITSKIICYQQINPKEEPSDGYGPVSPAAPAINFALAAAVAFNKGNPGNA
ncbi:hypothetical protein JYU34_019990 [Plutella xylostella]|uniref:Uncharacterized protein n=1 Tax=Plutella xylostella TaxID=51655 RepID=A0ABQ7PVP9_PLUXY|nr:hypothetical protein JYU34_019990 [Plutella xylostella]